MGEAGKKSMFGVFANRNFTRLFLAQITSQMGTTIGMMAFTFYLLDRFSSQPVYATVTELMYTLPTLCVFFVVGVIADRMDRQKIAAYTDWIRAGITVLMLAAVETEWMPLVFAFLFLRTTVAKFFEPASSALVQGILDKDEYTTAQGLFQMTGSVFLLFGTGLGAFCYWQIGIEGAMIVDITSFLISGLLIRSCKLTEAVTLPSGRTRWRELNLRMVLGDFVKGSKYILQHRLLLNLMLGLVTLGVVNGGLSVMPIFVLKYKLAPDDYEALSVTMSIAFGLGLLVGSPLAAWMAKRVKLHTMIIGSLLGAALLMVAGGLANDLWSFRVLYFLFALTVPFVNVPYFGWLPRIVDPKMMGRVQGWSGPLMMTSQSLTLGFIAVAYPAFVSLESLFYIVGGALGLTALFYLVRLPALARQQEASDAQAQAA